MTELNPSFEILLNAGGRNGNVLNKTSGNWEDSGGVRDDHPAERGSCARFSKTTLWLIGQGPRACKQDSSHNLSAESHAAFKHCVLLFSYNHFDSSSANLPGSNGRDQQRVRNKARDSKPVIRWVRRGGVRVNKVRHVEDAVDDHCCDVPLVVIKLRPNQWLLSSWWLLNVG